MDLSTSVYRDLLKFSVAGIVIIVPTDFTQLSPLAIEQIQVLEQIMLEETTSVPIYFIRESVEVMEVYKTVKESAESLGVATSALQSKFNNLTLHLINLCESHDMQCLVHSYTSSCARKWCATSHGFNDRHS